MYTTPHSKMRFLERVGSAGLPRKTKEKNKYIEKYLKKAYNEGLTPKDIKDKYLRDYMYGKMKQNEHNVKATKITHYKNNLFLFHKRQCITILDVPEKAVESVNNAIYITKLHPFINHLKERKNVKDWLHKYGTSIDNINNLKKCIITYPYGMDYQYIMNKFPLRCVKYIKNDSQIKKIIIKTNKKRKSIVKRDYYFICAMLMLFPKNQINLLQNVLKNNKYSVFKIINYKDISKKQLDTCYKQLTILLGNEIKPKYSKFNVFDNLCYDIINDYLNLDIGRYIDKVKTLFKDETKGDVN